MAECKGGCGRDSATASGVRFESNGYCDFCAGRKATREQRARAEAAEKKIAEAVTALENIEGMGTQDTDGFILLERLHAARKTPERRLRMSNDDMTPEQDADGYGYMRSLEAERDELRALVRNWRCKECNKVYPGPPQPGFACVICPQCGGETRGEADMVNVTRAEAAEAERDELRAEVERLTVAEANEDADRLAEALIARRDVGDVPADRDNRLARAADLTRKALAAHEARKGKEAGG